MNTSSSAAILTGTQIGFSCAPEKTKIPHVPYEYNILNKTQSYKNQSDSIKEQQKDEFQKEKKGA